MTSGVRTSSNPLFQGFDTLFGSRDRVQNDHKQIFSLNPLTPAQQSYLKRVYGLMTVGLASCFYAGLHGPSISPSMTTLAVFALSMYIGASRYRESAFIDPRYGRPTAFILISALIGLSIRPLLLMVDLIDPSLIYTSGLATLAVFGALSLASILNFKSRTFLYFGATIASFSFYLLLFQVGNMFFNSRFIFDFVHLAQLGLALAYTLYDTQLALASVSMGEEDIVGHALMFFFNFISLFVQILQRLAKSKSEEQEEERRRR